MVVSYSEAFKRQIKRLSRRYRRIRDDLQPIIDQLAAGQTPGDRIQGVGDMLYKVRVRNTSAGRGKSGGYRIIYYLRSTTDVLLVTIYSKADQSDIDVEALSRLLQEEG
ncbi:type II toxin-antitoxin system RelE/ParE family toxin [Thiocystis violacea]|uniref:type II toxin-antitoxin system RelE/ParE family toxin n=1 Tax=Thiocystis violacea TaxID=13725 RepID=UPI001902C99D|nr:addiction module antitoxin [Thiocystis violacea]